VVVSEELRDPDPAPEQHRPVLLAEVIEALAIAPGALIVDATLGLGGHAEAILERGGRVLGFDRDAESLALATARLERFAAAGKFRARHEDYRRILTILAAERTGPVAGVLADLGVSSRQLTSAERGFSFASEGILDMRMDRSRGETAADLVNRLPEAELRQLLYDYGEEPDARRIARAVVRRRAEAPFRTTLELAETVAAAHRRARPGTRHRLHPATLTFQALRIAVNDELSGLGRFVHDAVAALGERGRLVVIAFHSLEDRPVKVALRELEKGCLCPPPLPCVCQRVPQVRLLRRKPVVPGAEECAVNPRARSARLRAAEKITRDVAPELGEAA
jgi:16S rRNA (cytosine1402-N4)-methyltransferase